MKIYTYIISLFASLIKIRLLISNISHTYLKLECWQIWRSMIEIVNTYIWIFLDDGFSLCLKCWLNVMTSILLPFWFMQKMLKYDPADRISAKAAMDHPYFDSLDKCQFWNSWCWKKCCSSDFEGKADIVGRLYHHLGGVSNFIV